MPISLSHKIPLGNSKFWIFFAISREQRQSLLLEIGVEVSELFKPASTQKVVSGYLECDGRIVKVDSLDAVKRFVAEVETK